MAPPQIPGSRRASLRRRSGRILFCLGMTHALLAQAAIPASAQETGSAEVLDLPLERLLDVSVVSASRKTQLLSDVTSAVFVINQEDIRHSGATTIPDLLRMVPGVQVASIDANSWAVSIRGFNGTFANKLLVMIDGRSVYTSLYGGVFWDVQDLPLDNIERIEVIRGSGSTMWGANAVNGVINIITKNTLDTTGTLLTGLIGTKEHGRVVARYGAELGDRANYRIHLQHVDRGDTYSATPGATDHLQTTRGGFRVDSIPDSNLHVTVQGDIYGGSEGNSTTVPTFTPPFSSTINQDTSVFGADLLSRIDWLQSEASKFSLQLYYDRTDRSRAIIREGRDTFDLDLQHNVRFAGFNELTWGAGYRFLHDRTSGPFVLTPRSRSNQLLNLFVLDEITLLPETLRFIVGSKLEHNDFTGWEIQPSARLLYIPHKGYTLWTAVTRSVRTPSRSDHDVRYNLAVFPDPQSPLPVAVVALGNPQLKAESLLAYELGFRADLPQSASVDLTTFYNHYRDIIDPGPEEPFVEGGTQVTVPYVFHNLPGYDSWGAEISLQWQPQDWWKLKGGYSYIEFLGSGKENSLGVKATASHQATLRSMFAVTRDVDFDLWGRYVGANTYPLLSGIAEIPAYFTLDARLAWRPVAGVELSLVGRNLLEGRHLETVSDLTEVTHEVERSVYGKVSWAF